MISSSLRGRQLECRNQFGAEQPVAQLSHVVLGVQFDRRAPDDDLRVADVDAPPPGGAPLGSDIVADPLLADVEDQRLARRAPGVEALQASRSGVLQRLDVGADERLGEEGQLLQIGEGRHAGGVEGMPREQVAVVRHMGGGFAEQAAQALQAQLVEVVRSPPLRRFELTTDGDGAVLLQVLVHWEEQRGNESGIHERPGLTSRPGLSIKRVWRRPSSLFCRREKAPVQRVARCRPALPPNRPRRHACAGRRRRGAC